MRALFAGPGACRALVDGARGQVELVLSAGAYVCLEPSDWILLAAAGAAFGPLSVVVDGFDRLRLRPGMPAEVTGDARLLVGEQALSLARRRERRWVIGPARSSVACVSLPPPPAALVVGLAALADARVADAVRLLAGLGDGLTPAGDDVLAGYAATRVALGDPVEMSREAAGRSSPLGLAYLRCAERGELPDVAARLLAAVCRGSAAETQAAVGSLSAWGSSSGVALGWGINAGVACISRRASRSLTTVTS